MRKGKNGLLALVVGTLGLMAFSVVHPYDSASAPGGWTTLADSGAKRQEVSYVNVGGKLYLAAGGTAHQVYDPVTDSWSELAPLPEALDHIQGVALGGKIYYIGGLVSWKGPHSDEVYIYDPKTDTFKQGSPMPADRARGAGGVAVYKGKIYYAGGLHNGEARTWFDVYDPVADTWTKLDNMPRKKDHFHAAVVDGKLWAIGGRDADVHKTLFANDAYSFAQEKWLVDATGAPIFAPIPTKRGGYAAAVVGKEIYIIGGEGGTSGAEVTFDDVEAYHTVKDEWRDLQPMQTPRHGIQAAQCGGAIYIAAGGVNAFGSNPTNVHEMLSVGGPGCAAASARKPELDKVSHRKGFPRASWTLPNGVTSRAVEVRRPGGKRVVFEKVGRNAVTWKSENRVRPGTYTVRVKGHDGACTGQSCTAWSDKLDLVVGPYAAYKASLRSTHPRQVPDGRRNWTYRGDVVKARFRNLGNPQGVSQPYKVCYTKNKRKPCLNGSLEGAAWSTLRVRMGARWAGWISGRYVGYVRFSWQVDGRTVATKRIWIHH